MEDIIKMRDQFLQLNAIMKERLDEMNNMMNNDTEQWKVIDGYENYQVSNHGRVWSGNRKRIMKLSLNCGSLLRIGLYKCGKMVWADVHRLVAEAFIDNPTGKPHIGFTDNNTANVHHSNLFWCSFMHELKPWLLEYIEDTTESRNT